LDIDGWLRGIGLEQYAQTFRDNAIDADVLRDLTDEHLRELGLPLGARLKLLRAVAAIGTGEQTPTSPAVTPPAARTDAERRQVTVMFSDLVGSTALSTRMDPEDLREVISAYQQCVAETVRRFGGFVAKYIGDGVLVYFGYPQAHEDDAERAVRTGLELIAAVAGLKTSAPLQTRVGIATGLVVVSDLIGAGAAQEQAIVGETPNLAARLQGIAEPNMVVIAEGTRKLLGNLFELQDLGAKNLKGIAGPVRAWAALRASSAEGRFEALHAGGLTELVGREEELELLLRRWAKARTGKGQVVFLSGEAGIGKSRLTAALLERLADEPAHAPALLLLPAAYRQRALSDHQPDGTCLQMEPRRHTASKARQTRCGAGADLELHPRHRALCRDAVACERWTLSRARSRPAAAPATNAGGAHCTNRGANRTKTGVDDLRGCALGRPHQSGTIWSGG